MSGAVEHNELRSKNILISRLCAALISAVKVSYLKRTKVKHEINTELQCESAYYFVLFVNNVIRKLLQQIVKSKYNFPRVLKF